MQHDFLRVIVRINIYLICTLIHELIKSVFIQSGAVMFLEEDHYVSKEFLYILKLMLKESPKLCPFCDAYALGNHLDLDFFDYSKPDHVSSIIASNCFICI